MCLTRECGSFVCARRSVLGRNESEPISLESARSGGLAELSGNLPWATPALRALHDQWPSAGDIEQAHAVDDTTSSAAAVNENLLFRSSSGQVLVPFFDPGPRGTFLAQSPVSQSSSSSSSSSSSKGKRKQQVLRRHALVLTGDPRFPGMPAQLPWHEWRCTAANTSAKCAKQKMQLLERKRKRWQLLDELITMEVATVTTVIVTDFKRRF